MADESSNDTPVTSAGLFAVDVDAVINNAPSYDQGVELLQEYYSQSKWDDEEKANRILQYGEASLGKNFGQTPYYDYDTTKNKLLSYVLEDFPQEDRIAQINEWEKQNELALKSQTDPESVMMRPKLLASLKRAAMSERSLYYGNETLDDRDERIKNTVEGESFLYGVGRRFLGGATGAQLDLLGGKKLAEQLQAENPEDSLVAGYAKNLAGGAGFMAGIGAAVYTGPVYAGGYLLSSAADAIWGQYEEGVISSGDPNKAAAAAVTEGVVQAGLAAVGGKAVASLAKKTLLKGSLESAGAGVVGGFYAGLLSETGRETGAGETLDAERIRNAAVKNAAIGGPVSGLAGAAHTYFVGNALRPPPDVHTNDLNRLNKEAPPGVKTESATDFTVDESGNIVQHSDREGSTSVPYDGQFFVSDEVADKLQALKDTVDAEGNKIQIYVNEDGTLVARNKYLREDLTLTNTPQNKGEIEIADEGSTGEAVVGDVERGPGNRLVEAMAPRATVDQATKYTSRVTGKTEGPSAGAAVAGELGKERASSKALRENPELDERMKEMFEAVSYEEDAQGNRNEVKIGLDLYLPSPRKAVAGSIEERIQKEGFASVLTDFLNRIKNHSIEEGQELGTLGGVIQEYLSAGRTEALRRRNEVAAEKFAGLFEEVSLFYNEAGTFVSRALESRKQSPNTAQNVELAIRSRAREEAIYEAIKEEGITAEEVARTDQDIAETQEKLTEVTKQEDPEVLQLDKDIEQGTKRIDEIDQEAESTLKEANAAYEAKVKQADAEVKEIEKAQQDKLKKVQEGLKAAQKRIKELEKEATNREQEGKKPLKKNAEELKKLAETVAKAEETPTVSPEDTQRIKDLQNFVKEKKAAISSRTKDSVTPKLRLKERTKLQESVKTLKKAREGKSSRFTEDQNKTLKELQAKAKKLKDRKEKIQKKVKAAVDESFPLEKREEYERLTRAQNILVEQNPTNRYSPEWWRLEQKKDLIKYEAQKTHVGKLKNFTNLLSTYYVANLLAKAAPIVQNAVGNVAILAHRSVTVASEGVYARREGARVIDGLHYLLDFNESLKRSGWRTAWEALTKGIEAEKTYVSTERNEKKVKLPDGRTVLERDLPGFTGLKLGERREGRPDAVETLRALGPIRALGVALRALESGDALAMRGGHEAEAAKIVRQRGRKAKAQDLKKAVAKELFNSPEDWDQSVKEARANAETLKEAGIDSTEGQILQAAWSIMERKRADDIRTEAAYAAGVFWFNQDVTPRGFTAFVSGKLSDIFGKEIVFPGGKRILNPNSILQPILRTPLKIASMTIDSTLIGFLKAASGKYLVKEPPAVYRHQFSSAIIGTTLMGLMLMKLKADRDDPNPWFKLTGPIPFDPDERKKFENEGLKPWSMVFGDVVIPFNWTPLVGPLGAAAFLEYKIRSDPHADELSLLDTFGYLMAGSVRAFADLPMLRSLSNLTQAALNGEDRYGAVASFQAGIARNLAIPGNYILDEVSRVFDNPRSSKAGFWAKVLKGVPFTSEFQGLPALNLWGEPVDRQWFEKIPIAGAMFGRFVGLQKDDPNLLWLTNNGYNVTGIEPKITLRDDSGKYENVIALRREKPNYGPDFDDVLTESENYRLQKEVGPQYKDIVENFRLTYGDMGFNKEIQKALTKQLRAVKSAAKYRIFLEGAY